MSVNYYIRTLSPSFYNVLRCSIYCVSISYSLLTDDARVIKRYKVYYETIRE